MAAKKKAHKNWLLRGGVVLLYEDRDILVVDKPPGLLTAGTEKEKSRTVYAILSDYVKTTRKGSKIFIVHRLDRDTSGILLFAKNEKVKFALQDAWDTVKKRYLAVVHGRPPEESGTLSGYLAESGSHRVYATQNESEGKFSRTAYKVIKTTKKYSLLEIELLTGRKHQIRVHFADAGFPIIGDRKYGEDDPSIKRLGLHAVSLECTHPATGKPCFFETIVPPYFSRFTGNLPVNPED